MSNKKLDQYKRWRNKTVSFRMSPEENELLNSYVRMSGMEKQEYLIQRALEKPITVIASPKTYYSLKQELEMLVAELQEAESTHPDTLDRIEFLTNIIKEILNSKEI